MKNKLISILTLILLLASACDRQPDITDEMLDGNVIFDPSLYAPEEYILSYKNPDPTPAEASHPVIIAVHGYSATTFEWNELKAIIDTIDDVHFSSVLLGGHGRDFEDFKNASWKDWQDAITDEFNRLEE